MNEAGKPTAANAAPNALDAPTPQVVQLVRSIGAESTSEVQSVESVNAELGVLFSKGYALMAVRPVASVPGGVMVYYLFVKGL